MPPRPGLRLPPLERVPPDEEDVVVDAHHQAADLEAGGNFINILRTERA